MEKREAEQIAAAINVIRGDWPTKQIVTILGRHQHRPARDAMIALAWIAWEPDTISPARIDADGPWWAAGRLAGISEPTYTPPASAEHLCPMHGDRQPCRGCAADRKAAATETPPVEPMPERMEGESLIEWARRVSEAGR